MQKFNFEKYLTAEMGNPTQNSNRKYRIPNIEKYNNSGHGKSNPKIAIVNAQFEILRNT